MRYERRHTRRYTSRHPGSRRAACLARLFVAVLLIAALVATARAPSAAANISSAVNAALAEHSIDPSSAGIYIWDLDAGRRVYSLNGRSLFVPASNTKLVTTAAALQTWSADHRFVTRLAVEDVRIVRGYVIGDLYLTGGGDPSLATKAFQREKFGFSSASVRSLARQVRAAGMRGIAGDIVGDESWFDTERRVSVWKPGIERYTCGPLSALSVNEGFKDRERVAQPALHAARMLRAALREAGVKVVGRARGGRVPDGAPTISSESSAPLRVLLRRMNKNSDNYFAEVFVKGLGKDEYDQGSTMAGVTVAEETLGTMDIPATDYVLEDGSGLSYGNRLTPHALVRLLGAMSQRPDFGVFYRSLSVAGKDGTLAGRMKDGAAEGNARAKTGSLNIANGLSGYVTTANGHLLAFSILIAGNPVAWQRSNDAQDDIVEALAEARLNGGRNARPAATLRQRPVSFAERVHASGRALQPCVEP